jgi:hypothetical protein
MLFTSIGMLPAAFRNGHIHSQPMKNVGGKSTRGVFQTEIVLVPVRICSSHHASYCFSTTCTVIRRIFNRIIRQFEVHFGPWLQCGD